MGDVGSARTWIVPDPGPWIRDGLANPSAMRSAARVIRYREVPAARRGPDGDDGWDALSASERAAWVEKARRSFEQALS